MPSPLKGILQRLRPRQYARRPSLILLNGLAEQAESWYRNRRFWNRYFDVHAPNILVYEGDPIHKRIAEDQPISVDYLVSQLHTYLTQFVQTPPYHIVSSSLGGKVAVEFAHAYPELVSRMVLICPSGMGDKEQLPIMDGVRGRDPNAVVHSVFYNTKAADVEMLRYYKAKFANRRWKTGFLRTVRGTLDLTVRDHMKTLKCPTLLITGAQDKVCDPKTAEAAARTLPLGRFHKIPKCGHAPQIEKAWRINRLVLHFLTAPRPLAH
jgi:pimeloyl-ACP methyl ester carboxylesterase